MIKTTASLCCFVLSLPFLSFRRFFKNSFRTGEAGIGIRDKERRPLDPVRYLSSVLFSLGKPPPASSFVFSRLTACDWSWLVGRPACSATRSSLYLSRGSRISGTVSSARAASHDPARSAMTDAVSRPPARRTGGRRGMAYSNRSLSWTDWWHMSPSATDGKRCLLGRRPFIGQASKSLDRRTGRSPR